MNGRQLQPPNLPGLAILHGLPVTIVQLTISVPDLGVGTVGQF